MVKKLVHKKAESDGLEKNVREEVKKVAKSIPKSFIAAIPPEKYFVLCDGKAIKDYRELVLVLETLSDDKFFYHVNNDKNDFANWVNDVFKEEGLANSLKPLKHKGEMITVLYKFLFEKAHKKLKL